MEEVRYTLIEVNGYYAGVAASGRGLRVFVLPNSRREETLFLLKQKVGDCTLVEDTRFFYKFREELTRYFDGEEISFHAYSLDLSPFTPFQKDVWSITQKIPYGEVRTYGWIVWKLGGTGSPRAVGGALARNPLPIIIPCHRIVQSNHHLGGFSFGIEWKKKLLEIEGHDSVGLAKNIWNKTGTRHKKTSANSR